MVFPHFWPHAILTPRRITRHLAPRTTAGTVSASGFTQRVSVPAHAWTFEYKEIPVRDKFALATWDQMEALLDGGSYPVLVFLPGEGYQAAPDGTLDGAANAGDTIITITREDTILPGMHFSIGFRLYRVSKVITIGAGVHYEVGIRPPLRESVADATDVIFSELVCKCRLATDDEMTLEIGPERVPFGNIKFVEDPSE